MAPTKRKRTSTRSESTNKRPRYSVPSDSEPTSSPQEWKAGCILEERLVGRKRQYLIKWTDIDPSTGRVYPPTWEPKENANALLIASWAQEQASGGAQGPRREQPKKTPRPPRATRRSRIVETSPEPSNDSSRTLSRLTTPARDTTHVQSSTVTTPTAAPSTRTSPCIRIRPRGRSLDRDEYKRYPQPATSQPASSQSLIQDTDLDSSALFAAAPEYRALGIVPDSQSSEGEGNFVPATQQTTGTTEPSSALEVSQEDATQDSGLPDIVQEPASRAPSPARSIPETVYDTTTESESQRRGANSQVPIEICDTLETIESSSQTDPEAENNDQSLDLEEELQALSQAQSEQVHPLAQDATEPDSVEGASQRTTQPDCQQSSDRPLSRVQSAGGNHSEDKDASQIAADAAVEPSNRFEEPATATDLRSTSKPGAQSCDSETYPHARISDVDPVRDADLPDPASLTEHSALDEAAQFPFHSQLPHYILSAPSRPSTTQPVTDANESAEVLNQSDAVEKGLQTQNSIIPEATGSLLGLASQAEDDQLPDEPIEPELTQIDSPTAAREQSAEVTATETLVQSTQTVEVVRCRDFAVYSQPPASTVQSTASREQNAQIVSPSKDLNTQEEDTVENTQHLDEDLTTDSPGDVRPSIEEDFVVLSSPNSRHDSSQETPERQSDCVEHSSSPLLGPPNYSLGTLHSNPPPGPSTPVPTSSLSNMGTPSAAELVSRQMKERLAKRQAENPYTPIKRSMKSTRTPSTAPTADTPTPPGRRLLRTGASPSVTAAEGARSPSTIPDHSPAPPAPTSLRTLVLAQSSQVPIEEAHQAIDEVMDVGSPLKPIEESVPEPIGGSVQSPIDESTKELDTVPAIITTQPTVPDLMSSDDEELSDVGDDDEDDDNLSLLNDDLVLEAEEHIVPLFTDGRQNDMYSAHLMQNSELLERFLKDPENFEPLEKVEEVLSYLRAIETHVDLVFAEAESAANAAMNSTTHIDFAASFGTANSVKFKFLHSLFFDLRQNKHEKHVILVIDDDNEPLLNIIETFCRAEHLQYSMPTSGRQADQSAVVGECSVTIFPKSGRPITPAADLIICLDGVQDAAQLRKMNWAANSRLDVVPILHLVIPRSVGHIERYLSLSLNERQRAHTIVASLAQMHEELGKPIDGETPRANLAAEKIVEWLATDHQDIWPLTSIGSVKDVIEFQTQPVRSTISPVPERTKRPHDDEDLDPAKRMRFTPQPQVVPAPSSSIANENEITHISDSMPGTAVDDASLQARLSHLEQTYHAERAAWKAEISQFREREIMWDKQQTRHEDLTREHRLLLGKQQSNEEKIVTMTINSETLRERLATRTTEMRTLGEQLDAQRSTDSLSEDAKIVEITNLRVQLAAAEADKLRAIKNAKSAEDMLEYTKEQYRLAQDAATTSQSAVAVLEAQNAKLAHTASGQAAKLKSLFLNRQYDDQAKNMAMLKAENANLKKMLQQKDDDLARKTVGRAGVGTRGTSATPQPKTRSRAASPSGLGGRVRDLRGG